MLSEERRSLRSPASSVQSESIRTGPAASFRGLGSHKSSITEEDDNSIPAAPPLPSSFSKTETTTTSKPKAASVSASSTSSSSSSSPVQSTSKPATSGANATKNTTDLISQRSTLRHVSPTEQNKTDQRLTNPTSTTRSNSKRTTPPTYSRVSARDIENENPTTRFSPLSRGGGKGNQSIFEKIDTHGGHATYLGSGTFSKLENCIRECLGRDQHHTDISHHITNYHSPSKSLTRASVLEDYSYEGITSPHHHHHSNSHHHYHHADDHHHGHHSDDDHHHHGHHTKSAAELSLNEIREVNDALAKYGIPIFSQHPHHDPYQKYRPIGDIISACQLLIHDPAIRSHTDGLHATQNVWNALQHYQPPPQNQGYASPAVRAVASHLFQPNQTPYDPVHGVSQHIFGHSNPPAYNPNQGYASPPVRGVASYLFQPNQTPYSPVQGAASHLFSGQQQQQNYTAPPYNTGNNQYRY